MPLRTTFLATTIAAMAVAGLTTAAQPASAAEAMACNTWKAWAPELVRGTHVEARWATCANYRSHFKARLERERWYGWQNLDEVKITTVPGRPYSGKLSYKCDGDGTHTYRVYSETTNKAGQRQWGVTPERRFTC